MKRTLSLVAVAAGAALALSACGGAESESKEESEEQQSAAAETQADDTEVEFVIGVSQLVSHPSLDAAVEGFEAAFEDAGIPVTFDIQNANGDQSVAASIAGTFNASDTDLVLAVATPSAQAAAQAITDKPVLFTAVTDPVDAGLVESWEEPGGNVTGTSDANPVEAQLELIKEIVPDAKTIGIIYSPGEANSLVQVEWAKEAADKLGFELKEAPSVTSGDVLQAVESLSDVDAIYVPTDNIVVSSLETVLQYGETNKIPVFGAEGDSIERGAIATYGLNYFDLGYQTGQMAIEILKEGKVPEEISVETLEEPSLYINLGAAERMGVEIPEVLIEEADPENVTE